jgi:glucan-binding YG repeat protein
VAKVATVTANDNIWKTWSGNGAGATVASSTYYFDAESTWSNWCDGTATPTTTTDACATAWYEWNRNYETCGTTVKFKIDDTIVWEKWVSDETVVEFGDVGTVFKNVMDLARVDTPKFKRRSTEKKRAISAQAKINHLWRKVLLEEEEQEKAEAELTAQQLLLDLITEAEFKRYQETGQLFVKGERYDYALKKGGGVIRLHKNKVVDFAKKKKASGKSICVHPKRNYKFPPTDNVITLKMWIENEEKEFLRIGNLSSGLSHINDFDKVVGL